jgi:hypothetical protein
MRLDLGAELGQVRPESVHVLLQGDDLFAQFIDVGGLNRDGSGEGGCRLPVFLCRGMPGHRLRRFL